MLRFGIYYMTEAYVDGVGHYSRPDILTLNIRDEAWTPTGPQKLEKAGRDDESAQRHSRPNTE